MAGLTGPGASPIVATPRTMPASTSSANPTTKGTGLMAGHQVDPWGISQSITDAAGSTGSVLGGIGRTVQSGGTLLLGLLVIGAGMALLGWLFLTETPTGRGVRRAGAKAARTVAAAAVVAPK